MARDITEARRLETERDEFFNLSLDLFCVAGFDGFFKQLNSAWERVFGYSTAELSASPFIEFVHPDDRAATIAEAEKLAEGGTTISFENRYRCKDGSMKWLLWSATSDTEAGLIYAVARDVTERRQAEEDLRRARHRAEVAREEAEQASHAKSEFLSRMSHELRTPLNAILGFGQLMEMDHLDPEHAESVQQILKAGRHLLDLINEILDIARIEAGRLSLSIEPVSVLEVASEVIELVRPMAAARHIALLSASETGSAPFVLGDRQRIKQVLLNLLSNGIKYHREGGAVWITCETGGEHTRIAVTDNGRGIPEERLDELFTPFSRLGADGSGVEGTGLGLALSKGLVDAMGGTIGVRSTVGEGTTSWVDLVPAEARAVDATIAAAGPSMDSANVDGFTILYVEDNLANLKLVERLLERRPGIRLLSALQGRLGVDLARQHRPDLILLDLHLPDIPGEEVLAHLREESSTRDIPVVVISADATGSQIKRLMAAGARAYLTKPLDVKAFVHVIDEVAADRARLM